MAITAKLSIQICDFDILNVYTVYECAEHYIVVSPSACRLEVRLGMKVCLAIFLTNQEPV